VAAVAAAVAVAAVAAAVAVAAVAAAVVEYPLAAASASASVAAFAVSFPGFVVVFVAAVATSSADWESYFEFGLEPNWDQQIRTAA
jgi:hypothetical protein